MPQSQQPIGGGVSKILYTLKTARQIGITKSAKALTANNTCKACGLGMGGQRGGMVNEAGEFPSVCNKSIQAQSTDIQPPIPVEVFEHSLTEFNKLSARELEHLGRLGHPLFKEKKSDKLKPVDWEFALNAAAEKFRAASPERTFFYSSGRSSNEAGFVLQLFARIYGTNNVNNCSYYCHQATTEGLSSSIGTGTATIELDDLDGCDLIFVIGANPASNHPRFIHRLKACRERGGHVVVINPAKEPGLVRFAIPKSMKSLIAGGSEIASHYLQPKIGTDIALLKGLAKGVIENNGDACEFIQQYTEGFDVYRDDIKKTSWEAIENETGLCQAAIEEVAQVYCRANNAVFAWGMGVTHHRHGVSNVEAISALALLRGMVGSRYRGLLPLRGHSNVQGIGTIGVKPVLPVEVIDKIEQQLGEGIIKANNKGLDTLACLEAASNGQIDAALVMGGNLFQATPNTDWAGRALSNIPFKLYLTTTLNRGHFNGLGDGEALILPVAARDEEPQPTTQESMFNFVRMSDGGIARIANARSEVDVLVDMANRITKDKTAFDFSIFSSRESIRQTIASTVPDMQELQHIDVAKKEFHIQNRLMHKPEFKTLSGKARFVVSPIPKQKNREYPFCLMSVRSEGQFNSIIYEEKDSYRGTDNRWVLMLNAKDIEGLGLKAGDAVDVESAHGCMQGLKLVAFNVPIGNVVAYYPEANVLTGLERDDRSQTPAFKSVAVQISRRS